MNPYYDPKSDVKWNKFRTHFHAANNKKRDDYEMLNIYYDNSAMGPRRSGPYFFMNCVSCKFGENDSIIMRYVLIKNRNKQYDDRA